jgi:hypothetical protein
MIEPTVFVESAIGKKIESVRVRSIALVRSIQPRSAAMQRPLNANPVEAILATLKVILTSVAEVFRSFARDRESGPFSDRNAPKKIESFAFQDPLQTHRLLARRVATGLAFIGELLRTRRPASSE